jgi:hypothetical protein
LASPEKKFEQVEDALEAMFADFSGAFIKCFFLFYSSNGLQNFVWQSARIFLCVLIMILYC